MAKQLLAGQKIVVVRCEALNISGEFFRAKRTFYTRYLKLVEIQGAEVMLAVWEALVVDD